MRPVTFLLISLLGLMLLPSLSFAEDWEDDAWPYRIPVTVSGAGVVEVSVDFGAALDSLGLNNALLDVRSLRVVAYEGDAPVGVVPHEERYTTLLEDAEDLVIGSPNEGGVRWGFNDARGEKDESKASAGGSSLKAVIENVAGGYGYPGIELKIDGASPLADWSRYETFLFDIWPEVNESALDQAPDLLSIKIYNTTGCDDGNISQGGPAMALDRWNAVSVSLKPLHTCTTPNLNAITRVELHTRDNETVNGNSGLYDDGDVLTIWLDEVRLMDQNQGSVVFEAQANQTYYLYFDTLDHEGHPAPQLWKAPTPTQTATTAQAEAGGYYHLLAGAPNANGLSVWSAPPVEKILRTQVAPIHEAPLQISAAKGESEPFQLVLRSDSARDVVVQAGEWVHEGGGAPISATQVKLHRVDYVTLTRLSDDFGRLGEWPDPLSPLPPGASVSLSAGKSQPLWFTVKVPRDAAPGVYNGKVTLGGDDYPVRLRVWDFEMPQEIHLASEWGFGWSQVVERYKGTSGGQVHECYWGLVDALYEDFADHRLTPKGVGWPAGLNFPGGVEYDCAGNLDAEAWGDWGFGALSRKYLFGEALEESAGFPSFLIRGPASNWPPESRPSNFCDQSRGTEVPGDAGYNETWFAYWSAVSDYILSVPGLAERNHYHIVNEPQTFDDYTIAAYLSEATKAAAPGVRILLSEQVEPSIHSNPSYPGAKIDIWMPTISNYQSQRAQERQLHHDEEVWWYFLYGDRPPLPNPTIIDRAGIEARITPWLAWNERIDGLLYYAITDWNDPWAEPWIHDANGDAFMLYPPRDAHLAVDPCDAESNRLVSSIRWELLRDGMEDYEYLWLLNGGAPEVGVRNGTDQFVSTLVSSRTLFSRVPTDLQKRREELAALITGETCFDACAAEGTSCEGDTLVDCTRGSSGCLEVSATSCALVANGTCDPSTFACVTECSVECSAPGDTICNGDLLIQCETDTFGCNAEIVTDCSLLTEGSCNGASALCESSPVTPDASGDAGSGSSGGCCSVIRAGSKPFPQRSAWSIALALLFGFGWLRRKR